MTIDSQVRVKAFDWLRRQVEIYGEILPWKILQQGFMFENSKVTLIAQQGIFKPKILPEIPLSITRSPASPYDDHFEQSWMNYSYRGTDPTHVDNVGLKKAMREQVPLIYFHGVAKGKYLAAWPVYIVGDDEERLFFRVALDDSSRIQAGPGDETNLIRDPADEGRRSYITSIFKRRLHQQSFRLRVLEAYKQECAMCRLKHVELIDAAHITADSEDEGIPVVPNGLALCKLHHAAYDRYFLAITPDYKIEIRKDLLEESDGPMLQHGLKALHRSTIQVPRSKKDRPDRERLSIRYEAFLAKWR